MEPRKEPIIFYFATVAPLSPVAYQAGLTYLNDYQKLQSPEVLFKYEREIPVVPGIAIEAAKLIHCDPSEVTFIPNTTYGVNVASHALPLSPGDEIVVQGNEYKANFWPWIAKRKEGCVVNVIQNTDNAKGFEEVIAAITPKTKVVSVSWVQYYDGFISDLDRLSRICRENGTYLVVDAVQGIGIRAIDVNKTPIDILTTGSQKYLRAGGGGGFLYVNKKIMGELRDTFVGIRSMASSTAEDYVLKEGAERFQIGTLDMQAAVQLYAALKDVNARGIANIEQQNLALLRQFKQHLSENSIDFIDHGDRQGNIISLRVPDPKGLVAFLAKDRIYIKQIDDVARISFHETSTMSDFKEVAAKIKEFHDR